VKDWREKLIMQASRIINGGILFLERVWRRKGHEREVRERGEIFSPHFS